MLRACVKFLAVLCLVICGESAEAAKVLRVLPAGDNVTQVDSVNVTFSEPMTPLGAMEFPEAKNFLSIQPEINCEWRWISPETLSCKIPAETPLKPATRYRITVKKGLKGKTGKQNDADASHEFVTERPRVNWANADDWITPGFPILNVQFNQSISVAEVEKSAVVKTADGKMLALKAIPANFSTHKYTKDKSLLEAILRLPPATEANSRFRLRLTQELPAGTRFQILVKAGVRAVVGDQGSEKPFTSAALSSFPAFAFLAHDCRLENGESAGGGECYPLREVELKFSSPVSREELKRACTLSPMKDAAAQAAMWDAAGVNDGRYRQDSYGVSLPPLGKAKQEFAFSCAADLTDVFQRKLGKPITYSFRTSARRSEFRILHPIGILEQNADSEAPGAVTNLKDVELTYSTYTSAEKAAGKKIRLDSQKVEDLAYILPMKVREMLGGKSGAVSIVNPAPAPNGETEAFYQVSPYMVHFKDGYFGGALWVRDYATGEPVEKAEVILARGSLTEIQNLKEVFTYGKTDKFGVAVLPGRGNDSHRAIGEYHYGLKNEPVDMLLVRKGKEIALLPLTYSFQSYSRASRDVDWEYESENYRDSPAGHIRAWGTTPQGVYRSGEKIDYKIYVRGQDVNRLTAAPFKTVTLVVTDPTGAEVHRRENLALSEFGAVDGEFTTAKEAPTGWYQFTITYPLAKAAKYDSRSIATHRVLVTDFTPAPFKVSSSLDRKVYGHGDTLNLATDAKLHAGGPYGKAGARINIQLERANYRPDNPKAEQYSYRCGRESGTKLFEEESTLDDKGELKVAHALGGSELECGRIIATSDVADDRGRFYSSVATANYFGTSRLIGFRQDKYIYQSGDEWQGKFLVVDPRTHKPLNGVPFTVDLEYRELTLARVKGPGNTFLEEKHEEWKKLASCAKKSDDDGALCSAKLPKAGSYRVIARVTDEKGHVNENESHLWVSGKEDMAWESDDSNGLKIIAAKNRPKVGEKAVFLVQNPLPGGEAWISVERYGVLKSWHQKFQSATPTIEFEIEPDMLPGFYLSVTVFSPRVDKPITPEQVDLGKPTFRQGYVLVDVENPVKELAVKASSDKKSYRPGETVKIQLEAASRLAGAKTGPVEFAVAVLDESVFDLIQGGNNYFDVYRGLNWLAGIDVQNFNTLMMLVGRRKFEKKGANAGGDGAGGLAFRSNFKYVAHWAASVKADSGGKASLEFKAPDNLTGWKVLVMAANPGDRMGLGVGRFTVNQSIEIRPAMPNLVREGDSFRAIFTVMNRTEKKLSLDVEMSASGDLAGGKEAKSSLKVETSPFERKLVELPLEASLLPEDRLSAGGRIQFRVSASGGGEKDGFLHSLPVWKKRTLLAAASYRSTVDASSKESIAFPKDIYTDVGGVRQTVSPTVVGNVDGAFRYMRDYPYECWEQKLSKGVMASSYTELREYLDPALKWDEAKALVGTTLAIARNYQASNGGMCYYSPSTERASPYLSAFTALGFEWLKARGEKTDPTVEAKLHEYLVRQLRTDKGPAGYEAEMVSTVNAVTLAALARAKKIKAPEIERFRGKLKQMDLFGRALFLEAALQFPEKEAAAKEALNLILGAANETAGKFRFSEKLNSYWNWIHSTELRTHCALLSSISLASGKPWAKDLVKDIPFKLLRAITDARGKSDHWENTQENLFCTEALRAYAARFETEKPDMKVEIALGSAKVGEGTLKDFRDKPIVADYNIKAGDAGRAAEAVVKRDGKGRYYHSTVLRYAPKEDFKQPRNSGVEIKSEWSVERNGNFVVVRPGDLVFQGERLRCDVLVHLPSARNFLVVNVPVAGGLEPLNTDLANTSQVDAGKAESIDPRSDILKERHWIAFGERFNSFYFREVRHDSVRFYSEFVEKGAYRLSFMTQAIGAGKFNVPPAKAEEMYDADVYGHGVGSELLVEKK